MNSVSREIEGKTGSGVESESKESSIGAVFRARFFCGNAGSGSTTAGFNFPTGLAIIGSGSTTGLTVVVDDDAIAVSLTIGAGLGKAGAKDNRVCLNDFVFLIG